ncbi:MAG: hypothetical protein JST44_18100 [Cyanobacteria bacterium SZAS LIN-5]|nr:hypothetical protein [Cyanobacteria bacterium SZAS LIN-5]
MNPSSDQPENKNEAQRMVWHPVVRVLFRFVFAFLVLDIFPFPLYHLQFLYGIPYVGKLIGSLKQPFDFLIPYLGKICFGLGSIQQHPMTGSSDTTYHWLEVFSYLVVAAMAAAIWSAFDWKRKNYVFLHKWLRLYVRLYLASILLSYGAVKIFPSQFPAPNIWRLVETYGDSSPMGLMWTFMGASKTYTMFTGVTEFAAGILLLFPRFVTLGALISVAVFVNVFMLNISYDVPVKLQSFLFLSFSLVLLIPDIPALTQLLLFRKMVAPALESPYFANPRACYVFSLVQIAFGIYVGCLALSSAYEETLKYGEAAPKSVLYGLWSVDEFILDGKVVPPLLTDKERWGRLIFDNPKWLTIMSLDGKGTFLDVSINKKKHLVSISQQGDNGWKADFSLNEIDDNHIVLEGTQEGKHIRAALHKEEPFLLRSRGFHWISERPFNR